MIKPRRKEEGAVILTVAFALLLLLGFMGIALDFGHLFVIRTELQTSMDACALAAAQEMDGQPDSLTRGSNAGITAGNLNAVDMQSASWSGKTRVSAADIAFLDQNYVATGIVANVRFVRCQHTQPGTATRLIHALSVLPGSPAYAGTMNVSASAIATMAPSQSACPMPLAMHPKSGGVKPNYGFTKGEWVTLLSKGTIGNGMIGWANLDGSSNASETAAELDGYCGTKVGDHLGTPGVQSSVIDNWNARFGIYKNNSGPDRMHPDFTGVVYNAKTWGPPDHPSPPSNALGDFLAKRQTFTSCTASATTVAACESATGLSLNSFKSLATPGPNGELRQYGMNRRLVAVPVVDDGPNVIDFACMLLLQPIPAPFSNDTNVMLEYVGSASEPGSPCTSNGLAGGTAGPLVPVLVR
jgi:Flp pilus assembly protein TadG